MNPSFLPIKLILKIESIITSYLQKTCLHQFLLTLKAPVLFSNCLLFTLWTISYLIDQQLSVCSLLFLPVCVCVPSGKHSERKLHKNYLSRYSQPEKCQRQHIIHDAYVWVLCKFSLPPIHDNNFCRIHAVWFKSLRLIEHQMPKLHVCCLDCDTVAP